MVEIVVQILFGLESLIDTSYTFSFRCTHLAMSKGFRLNCMSLIYNLLSRSLDRKFTIFLLFVCDETLTNGHILERLVNICETTRRCHRLVHHDAFSFDIVFLKFWSVIFFIFELLVKILLSQFTNLNTTLLFFINDFFDFLRLKFFWFGLFSLWSFFSNFFWRSFHQILWGRYFLFILLNLFWLNFWLCLNWFNFFLFFFKNLQQLADHRPYRQD